MIQEGAHLLVDAQGRILRDLRISVTDRCNFRCQYCLPETEAAASRPSPRLAREWTPRSQLLSFEEIERVARVAAGLGVQKIRLTGGEPLLRRQIETLVGRLARITGVADLALTSNGFLFPQKARALRDAGLRRISFSLDSLDPGNFQKITGWDGLEQVLAGVALAQELGLGPVKINAVIIRGMNDHEIEALAGFGRAQGLSVRFIEFMPMDSGRAWKPERMVPGREILERLHARFALRPVPPANPSETARRWAFADGRGEIGIIASVTEPFCGHCNRLRLTADGKVRTCLFSVLEHDLRARLRQGATDAELGRLLQEMARQKEAGHRVGQPGFIPPARSMHCVGG